MEYRTAIFLSIFQKTFLEKNVEKKLFHLFFLNFFNFISEKKVKIFFEKLNFFLKKSKLCDSLSQLGNARVI